MQGGLDSVKVKPVRRLCKKGHGDLSQNISGGNRKGTTEVTSAHLVPEDHLLETLYFSHYFTSS